MPTTLSLSHMVDLALGTPEVGSVNFNVLHTLLHAVLQKLDLNDVKANITEEDQAFLARKKTDLDDNRSEADSAIAGMSDRTHPGSAGSAGSKTPYHQLEQKVANLEKQMDQLNQLPTTGDLVAKSRGDAEQARPVSDMWQNMQLGRKVDANEQGVDKLMQLVDDMMKDMHKLREENDKMKKDLEDAVDKISKASNIDELLKKIQDMEDRMTDLASKLDQVPSLDMFDNYVSWAGLEDALRGMRDAMEPKEVNRVVIEMSSQTEAPPKMVSRPVSARTQTPSRGPSRASTPGPSNELQELLERLGRLSDQHDILQERVDELEKQLANKADRDALDGLIAQVADISKREEIVVTTPVAPPPPSGIPEDLLQQLRELQDQLDQLKKTKDKAESIESLKQTFSQSTDISDEIAHKLSDLQIKISDLEQEMSTLAVDSLSSHKELEMKNNLVQGQVDELFDVVSELKSLIDKHDTEIADEPPPLSATSSGFASGEDDGGTHGLEKMKSHLQQQLKKFGQEINRDLRKTSEILRTVQEEMAAIQDSIRTKSLSNVKQSSAGKDSDILGRLQQTVVQLQSELERLSNTSQQLVDENNNRQKDVDELFSLCTKLEENKADKEFVQNEVEVKADKRHLDGKVNRSLFDNTCDELNKMINDILNKLMGHDEEWKKALAELSNDLDGKLDRLEFGPIKDQLERQLRDILKKLKGLNTHDFEDDDEAAGLRRQLMQKFHCISCDRPVDMTPQGPVPSIPAPNSLPATRSARPYTTFELEQIRQHAKRSFVVHYGSHFKHDDGSNMNQVDIMDLYATQRACGGNHTLTYPHRRATRLTQMNNLFREEEVVPNGPLRVDDQDIQGADGHVYKGRPESRLPNLTTGFQQPQPVSKSPMPSRKMQQTPVGPHPPAGQAQAGQGAPRTPRPSSARMSQAPSAVQQGSRPSSALPLTERPPPTEVPTGGREPSSPPPPPAPSEPDPSEMQHPV